MIYQKRHRQLSHTLNNKQFTINDLQFGYSASQPILKGVDLTVSAGEKHGILGANGAGKTTLFQLISGMLPAKSGSICIGDDPVTRSMVSCLEAEPYFYPYMTGLEYLRFIHDDPMLIDRWNKVFDLPLAQFAETYSTGMKKKLGLIGVLLQQERPLLILDEPFNGVDFESNEKIMAVLGQGLAGARTMLISSHILPTLTRVCDRISVLLHGKIEKTYARSAFDALEEEITDKIALEVKNIFE